jgi:membrane protein
VWLLFKTTGIKWWVIDPFRQSAVIAYYAIFSLPALLVIIITMSGFLFGADAANGKILMQVEDTMGAETAGQIKEMLAKATEAKTSVWAIIIGTITMLIGAVGVFVELQKTLNIIWEVEATLRKANGILSSIYCVSGSRRIDTCRVFKNPSRTFANGQLHCLAGGHQFFICFNV